MAGQSSDWYFRHLSSRFGLKKIKPHRLPFGRLWPCFSSVLIPRGALRTYVKSWTERVWSGILRLPSSRVS